MKPCETKGTLAYFKKYRWKDLNKRTVNGSQSTRLNRPGNAGYKRKQIRLDITKDQFYQFCDDNKLLILELYKTGTPSIDRINSNGHYSLDNIRVIELKMNIARRD